MNKKQLKDIVALGEGFTTEFKRAGASNLGREICAFANATGEVVGQQGNELRIMLDSLGMVLKVDLAKTQVVLTPP